MWRRGLAVGGKGLGRCLLCEGKENTVNFLSVSKANFEVEQVIFLVFPIRG